MKNAGDFLYVSPVLFEKWKYLLIKKIMAYDAKEWYRQMFGILEDISNLNDSECEKMDQEFDRISQQQKIKNITL